MDRKVSTVRRVAVFKINGTALYDQLDESFSFSSSSSSSSASASASPSSALAHHTIGADALWPLIQVFIKFSRDVQGGHIRRLVFRSPAAYAPSSHRFAASAHARTPGSTVVYVAQSDRYVVAVTHRDDADKQTAQRFVSDLLDFLHREHGTFLFSSDDGSAHQKGTEKQNEKEKQQGKQMSNLSSTTATATPSTTAPTSDGRNSLSNSSFSRMSPATHNAGSGLSTKKQAQDPHPAPVAPSSQFINHAKIAQYIRTLSNPDRMV